MVTTEVSSNSGGFAAGTQIHTREGLRPIEQVRAGDWVLSKSLSSHNYTEYKRVLQVCMREQSLLNYFAYESRRSDGERIRGEMLVAPEHLAWTGIGSWREIGELKKLLNNMLMYALDESKTLSRVSQRLYISATSSVAWVPIGNLDEVGSFFDLERYEHVQDPNTGKNKSDWFGQDLGRDRRRLILPTFH